MYPSVAELGFVVRYRAVISGLRAQALLSLGLWLGTERCFLACVPNFLDSEFWFGYSAEFF